MENKKYMKKREKEWEKQGKEERWWMKTKECEMIEKKKDEE